MANQPKHNGRNPPPPQKPTQKTHAHTHTHSHTHTLTCVAMSPFSSTIDGGRSAPSDFNVSADATAVADARIHRRALCCCAAAGDSHPVHAVQAPPPAVPRDEHGRRWSGDLSAAAALGTNAAGVVEKALTATDLCCLFAMGLHVCSWWWSCSGSSAKQNGMQHGTMSVTSQENHLTQSRWLPRVLFPCNSAAHSNASKATMNATRYPVCCEQPHGCSGLCCVPKPRGAQRNTSI